MVKSLLGMYWGYPRPTNTGIMGGGYPLSVYTIPPNTQAHHLDTLGPKVVMTSVKTEPI